MHKKQQSLLSLSRISIGKIILVMFILTFIYSNVLAQTTAKSTGGEATVCENDEYVIDEVDTEADIEAVRNCRTILGKLRIMDTDLTNLDFLINVRSIYGLSIGNNAVLENIDGLRNLESIASDSGNIHIMRNPLLQNIDVFAHVPTIDVRYIHLRRNATLHDIDGFINIKQAGLIIISSHENLENIDGLRNLHTASSLEISNNPRLKTVDNLVNLHTLYNGLHIQRNAQLESLRGFENITSLGVLTIQSNPLLTSLEGLDNLEEVGIVRIERNPALVNLDAFANLTDITDEITISHNESLQNIEGLKNVESVGEAPIEQRREASGSWDLELVNISDNATFDCTAYNQEPYMLNFFPVQISEGNLVDCNVGVIP